MSFVSLLVLGLIAGFTIFLGLPIGRVHSRSTTLVSMLNALTIGVLIFLLWDVVTHAIEPIETSLIRATSGHPSAWPGFAVLCFVLVVALGVGMLGLVAFDSWGKRRQAAIPDRAPGLLRLDQPAARLAFLIAVGIGLHNFSEGLAIGQSAASGQLQLAVVLVIGFGLHNATEGFGITAPLAGGAERPTWRQLGILGLISGLPTLIGTLLGGVLVNDIVSVAFLALAAGSIIYVIVQLIGVALRLARSYHLFGGILAGMAAGFATDFIVTAAGV
jgi:ZIP family zinc transporter